MKKSYKLLSTILCILFGAMLFISCDPYKEIKKASKGLSTYNIEAVVNSEEMSVSAKQEVKVVNNYDVILDKICFNLYARAFRENSTIKPYTTLNEGKCFPNGVNYGDISILRVTINGKDTEFNYTGVDDNALEVVLTEALEPKDSVIIQIDFNLKLAECVHRLGYYNGNINLGNWFPILAVYENGGFVIDPYYSTGDPFYSDIANFNVGITYPDKYYLSSTGVKKSSKNEENMIKDRIDALAVRDFAVFLSENAQSKNTRYKDTTISYIGYKQDENNDYCLSVAKKAVKYFCETFGSYPYESLHVVKSPFIHGGMEYPNVVIISDYITDEFDLAKVIVHEIAHQWWYAVVGNNQVNEAWLDESLAEYSTVLFFADHKEFDVTYEELVSESFANYTLFADISSSLSKKINTSMLLPVNEYNSEYEYSYMIYVRGVLMFDSITQVVGQDNIKKTLKKYYSKYKYKIAKTDDLIAMVRKVTNKNIEGVMDSWLNGKTVIGTI